MEDENHPCGCTYLHCNVCFSPKLRRALEKRASQNVAIRHSAHYLIAASWEPRRQGINIVPDHVVSLRELRAQLETENDAIEHLLKAQAPK